ILALGGIAAVAAFLSHRGIAAVIGWLKARAVATPNHRSSHTVPTPQGGGIVVVPVTLVTSGVALWRIGSHVSRAPRYAALVGAAPDMRPRWGRWPWLERASAPSKK